MIGLLLALQYCLGWPTFMTSNLKRQSLADDSELIANLGNEVKYCDKPFHIPSIDKSFLYIIVQQASLQ